MSVKRFAYMPLIKSLEPFQVKVEARGDSLCFIQGSRSVTLAVCAELPHPTSAGGTLHLDQLIREPEKIAALILSRLHLNTTVFARNCAVKKVEAKPARDFLEAFHIMGATSSAFNLGLYNKDELVALGTFSKGRKMNRLPEDRRSFELIRFCCKSGITVTGGLTRLVKHFCREKKAGDVMTYVDKQLSDGNAFIKAGFKKHSETAPNYFLVDKRTQTRTPAVEGQNFDSGHFYLSHNAGNIKLVYTPLLPEIE